MTAFRTDFQFAPVPMWVLDLPISDRAVRIYATISAMRDFATDEAPVRRRDLATRLGVSVDSIDRAKSELIDHGALAVLAQRRNDGGQAENAYVVHRIPPENRGIPAAPVQTAPSAAEPDTPPAPVRRHKGQRKPSQSSSSSKSAHARVGRAPATISRKQVTGDEEHFALEVLAIFNEVSGRNFGSQEAIRKIILRHREHPKLSLKEHRGIIEGQFARPWWTGDPSVNVIYGNGDVFDRALNGVGRGPSEADAFEAYRD